MLDRIDNLHDMFLHELQAAYHMETSLVEILEEMAAKATNDRISAGFADHAEETREHVQRVEKVFDTLGLDVQERNCPIVEALDQERTIMEESVSDDDLLNMFYLGAGMKTERIEITTYDSLIRLAEKLQLGDDVVDPLEANRESETEALDQLQILAGASDLKSLWERLMP